MRLFLFFLFALSVCGSAGCQFSRRASATSSWALNSPVPPPGPATPRLLTFRQELKLVKVRAKETKYQHKYGRPGKTKTRNKTILKKSALAQGIGAATVLGKAKAPVVVGDSSAATDYTQAGKKADHPTTGQQNAPVDKSVETPRQPGIMQVSGLLRSLGLVLAGAGLLWLLYSLWPWLSAWLLAWRRRKAD